MHKCKHSSWGKEFEMKQHLKEGVYHFQSISYMSPTHPLYQIRKGNGKRNKPQTKIKN